MKKLIVFDLDGTLVKSKSALDFEMAGLLHELLSIVQVAVISGGDWPQFEKQVLSHLPHDTSLGNLSLLPTCGTKFFRYTGTWKKLYEENFTPDEKAKIIGSLKKAVAESGFTAGKVWGEITILDALIPGFSVRLGGATSVDVTKPGIDKAYGIGKLRDILGISLNEMLFVGDALFPGGNDYPAQQAGVVSICVRGPDETKRVIQTCIACLSDQCQVVVCA